MHNLCSIVFVVLISFSPQKQKEFIDESISSVSFGDSKSFKEIFGDLEHRVLTPDSDAPLIVFINSDSSSSLTLKKWYGDGENVFRSCEVSYYNQDSILYPYNQSNIDIFKSGKGIELGLNKLEILGKLGYDCFEISRKNETILTYLDKNLLYEAQYTLREDKLYRYNFGYLYP